MNETMSLLLVTAVLAVGGLGLFMYKTSDNENAKGGSDYQEDELFGNESFWGTSNEYDEDEEDYVIEPKVTRSRGGKTKRNKKSGGTKRRY
jgi:hypothetical protein